jgi:trigger factor
MAKIVKEDIGSLDAKIIVDVERAEYEKAFNAKVLEQSRKADLKGFRKGKVPTTFIKKMFGKGIMNEVVSDGLASNALFDFLEANDLRLIAQPLLLEQTPQDFNPEQLCDYRFEYIIGLEDPTPLSYIGKEDVYDRYVLDVRDEMVQEELDLFRRQQGKSEELEEAGTALATNDMLQLRLRELGEDGQVKQDGLETYASFLLDEKLIAQEVLEDLLTRKIGDTFGPFNPYNVELNAGKAVVRERILGIDADNEEVGELFEAHVSKITRSQPAAIDEALFNAWPRGEGQDAPQSEEEMRARIRQAIQNYYDNMTKAKAAESALTKVLSETKLAAPLNFLRETLLAQMPKLKDDPEELQKQLDSAAADVSQQLVFRKLREKYNIVVSKQDIIGAIRQDLIGSLGSQIAPYLTADMLERFYEDAKKDRANMQQREANVFAAKAIAGIKEDIGFNNIVLGKEEFEKTVLGRQDEEKPDEAAALEEEVVGLEEE